MTEWLSHYNEQYMTVTQLNQIFEDQEKKNKSNALEFNDLNAQVRAIKEKFVTTNDFQIALTNYAEKDLMDNLVEQVNSMPTTSGMEIRFSKIDERLEDMMGKIRKKYATLHKLEQSTEHLSDTIFKQVLTKKEFKKEWKVIDEKVSELELSNAKLSKKVKETHEKVKDIRDKIHNKAEQRDVTKLASEMRNFASFKDLQELYGKVVPQLSAFEGTMSEFQKGHQQFEEMLQRYDEIISQKASKTSLIGVEKKFIDKYAKKDEVED